MDYILIQAGLAELGHFMFYGLLALAVSRVVVALLNRRQRS